MTERDERIWEEGWEGHALSQRRRLAKLSFAEKLEWLESAQRLASSLGKSRFQEHDDEDAKPEP